MIAITTNMKEIPTSCILCSYVLNCALPAGGRGSRIREKYKKCRHEGCPLIEIEKEEEGKTND